MVDTDGKANEKALEEAENAWLGEGSFSLCGRVVEEKGQGRRAWGQ
jgi:hypothetical protein